MQVRVKRFKGTSLALVGWVLCGIGTGVAQQVPAGGAGGTSTRNPAAAPAAAKAPEGVPALHLPYQFRNVAIVAGGFISGIVPHPTAKGLMYLRTDIGGAYRSEDSGGHWTPITDWVSSKDSNLLGIESIAVDPTDPQKVYLSAGTYDKPWAPNGAVLISDDQGKHFQVVNMPFKIGGNEDGRFDGERMAVDPNHPTTLYLGTRENGLWTSTDSAKTWAQVDGFPGKSTNKIGVVFVTFEGASGSAKAATPVIYVGVSATDGGLFRSTDAGKTWSPVAGAPTGLLPSHGEIGGDWLYLTYGDAPGPNGMKDGAVWKFNLKTGKWKNVTPEIPGANHGPEFGYGGLAVDPEHPDSLIVSTMDHWNGGDNIYRSTDGGGKWTGLKEKAEMDASLSPYLAGEDGKVGFGHWIGAMAIDPFDAGHALYGTGATVWTSHDLTEADAKKPTHWVVGANGIEETAVISLLSPPDGPHLFSGLGDIGCFRNDDFDVSPRGGALKNPPSSNCDSIDYAVMEPTLMARVGRVWGGQAHGGISTDGGATWRVFRTEPPNADMGGRIALSSDGKVMVWVTGKGVLGASNDQGSTWKVTDKAPEKAQIVSDRMNPERFYLYDPEGGKLFVSNGLEADFKAVPLDVPKWGRLFATPGLPDNLWIGSDDGLWHLDATATPPVAKLDGVQSAAAVGFGKAEKDGGFPTLFLSGKIAGVQGVFRSTDIGKTWFQIDDDDHHYGWIGVVSGDPRVFGRVYMGTNGRGVISGDPAQ
jgi:photosystem II stability/assembly factor-like uncharacterized protein